jgi:hypothetical protein
VSDLKLKSFVPITPVCNMSVKNYEPFFHKTTSNAYFSINPSSPASCQNEQENNPTYGNYSWPTTVVGERAEINCVYNVSKSDNFVPEQSLCRKIDPDLAVIL